jgi:hypothetical protein
MKITCFLIIFCCLAQINISAADSFSSFEQNDSSGVQQYNSQQLLLRRNAIYFQNNLLSYQEVMDKYQKYPELSKLYSTGYKYSKVSTPLLIGGIVSLSAGAVLIGSGLFMILLDPASNIEQVLLTGYALAVVGNSMIPVAIILKIMGKNKISGSVKRYNQSLVKKSDNTKFHYSFGILSSGIGLQVRF